MTLSSLLAGSLAAASSLVPSIPVEQYRLENGMAVLLSEDHRLPVVAVEVRYLVGSSHERPGRTGFAHLFEHLMFQGSKSHDADYFRPFEPIGGAINGSTNTDRTNYYERVPKSHLELALWMESDRMESLLPALTQKKLDNQRSVVLNERRQHYENPPYSKAWQALSEALYPPSHPYRHLTIGYAQDIEAANLEDVNAFFRQFYVPSNAVLTVVGDFEPDRVRSLVDQYFGHIPSGQRALVPRATMPIVAGSQPVTLTDRVHLPRIYLAWHTPALYEAGDAELDLWASILSHGKSSRLYEQLVYRERVAKDVAAYQASQRLSSYFVIQATAAPGKTLAELERSLLASLKQALASVPTAAELQAAINHYRKGFFAGIESVVSRSNTLGTYYQFTGTGDYLAQDLARYLHASSAGVHHTARQWLAVDRLVRVNVVPERAHTSTEAAAP
ncbi:M16 family metallopeptidase [Myxococcota bacterium]